MRTHFTLFSVIGLAYRHVSAPGGFPIAFCAGGTERHFNAFLVNRIGWDGRL